ncbi:epididymal secretory protein E3-beta isoform X2 [Mustela lutreola]|uniref:epididymal secretory protein E3-beta isoform X2 n=1 Tax=Mustela lutreola TaxID=9666 RepID=UPI002796E6EB|nr:epididymal secretory protein E3-beta isoform X2 [Mustela lutreola]
MDISASTVSGEIERTAAALRLQDELLLREEGLRTLPCCKQAMLAYLAEEQQTKASKPGTNHSLCPEQDPQQGDLKK